MNVNYRVDSESAQALLTLLERQFTWKSEDFLRFEIDSVALGWVNERWAARLSEAPEFVRHANGCALRCDSWVAAQHLMQNLAQRWRDEGVLTGWRNEKFDVCADGQALFELERTAFRPFGLQSRAVHVNGLCRQGDELLFWIGRRSPFKFVDPDKLDNLVGGGIAAGETVAQALAREGFEEAGQKNIVEMARAAGSLLSIRPVARGLHREVLHVFDAYISQDAPPVNQDGEVAEFQLMPAQDIVKAMLEGRFMNDALLTTLDAFRRLGWLDEKSELHAWLKRAVHQFG